MIISHVIGGLGNQMFQYAIGKARAVACRTELRLDISDYSRYSLHQGFELERIFVAPIVHAEKVDIQNVLGWQSSYWARKILRRSQASWLRKKSLVVEPNFAYWPEILETTSNSYLTGNWQSEKYFVDIESILRKDFSFRQDAQGLNAHLENQMRDENSVSLHIRRGDYVTNSHTNAVHGVCSPEYYKKAIAHVSLKVENPSFYIFSDDMAWVKANFVLPFRHTYVEHNVGAESYNDMRLMSLCRHHVIANSSFSWWGAWLNQRTEKLVIAPKHWFAENQDVSDLFCPNWVSL